MRFSKLLLSLVVFVLFVSLIGGCTPERIKLGEEGILVKRFGANRGIQSGVIAPGTVWTGVGEYLVSMPTKTRSYPFTADSRPGSPDNEAVRPGDRNGTPMVINWALEGSIMPGASPVLYKKYMLDYDQLLHGPLRQLGEKGWTQYCRQMDLSDIVGAGGSALLDSMTNYMNTVMAYVEVDGKPVKVYNWERIFFVSMPEPVSEEVKESINKITSARNNYLAKVTNAKADSAERIIAANSIDMANKIVNSNLTALLVDYERAKNWRPLAVGSGAMVNIPASK